MATRWYYQSCGQKHGPIGFAELVQLVREGSLVREDLVRSDWDERWRWADSVPGLFYVAQRPAALAEPVHAVAVEAAVETANEPEAAVSPEQSGGAADVIQPGWLQQLLSFRSSIKTNESRMVGAARGSSKCQTAAKEGIDAVPARETSRDEAAGTGQEASRIGAAARSALDAIERRESRRQHRLIVRLFNLPKLSRRLALFFPWACSLAAGNAAAYATLNWSEAEALRFPGRDPANQQWSFPLYGDCGVLEYVFLLGNVALLAAVLGYGLASVLQAFADE